MKVKITYYKATGKWYSDEEFESKLPEGSSLHHYWEELEQMFAHHKRPGLLDGENEFFVVIEVPGHEHAHPRMILPKGKSGWLCPKCGRDRRRPYDDNDKIVPCCNPKCKGVWGTGCYCCHHPKFLEKDESPAEDTSSLMWVCPECGTSPEQGYECCNLDCKGSLKTGCWHCHHPSYHPGFNKPTELLTKIEKLTGLYEKEFDKRVAIRKWWRSNLEVTEDGRLAIDDQALQDLRELIADHSFDEHMTLGTKDQRIYALKEELTERCDRIAELERDIRCQKDCISDMASAEKQRKEQIGELKTGLSEARADIAARIAFEQVIQGKLQVAERVIEEGQKEAFKLAAYKCDYAVGDERGNLTCSFRNLERQLRALIADSKGVSHVHQSEDVASWEELIETGFLDALKEDDDAES